MVVIVVVPVVVVDVAPRRARSPLRDGGCGSSMLAEQQHQGRSEEREQRNQPDEVEKVHGVSYHFSKSTSSASTVSLLRNSAIRMPSPTAASATASVITKMAKIWPFTFCQRLRERDQVDVHGVQNQLDGHQNDHDIAAGQHAHRADQQQRRAQRQVVHCR